MRSPRKPRNRRRCLKVRPRCCGCGKRCRAPPKRCWTSCAPHKLAVGFARRRSLVRDDLEPLSHIADEVRDFLDRAAIPVHIVAADGTILWANKAELDLLGYAAEEYVG